MSMVVRGWKVPNAVIGLSCLITKDLQACMACVLPETQLCLLDTQLLFQLCHVKNVISGLKEWIRKNTGLMSVVSQHLHSTAVAHNGGGIHDLLHFRSLNLPSLSVQVVSDKLFRKDGAYIVIGGLTGLGWICVEFLAQNNAGFIAIVNRRAPSSEQTANMKNFVLQFGCRIKSFQGDVSSMKSLQTMLEHLSDEWSQTGQVRDVFTKAAVLEDDFFPSMTRSAFERVLNPKVKGSWNLHQLTKDLPLDYFVMHSSVASVLGNLGQANYATANAFMDGLAFHRRCQGLAAQTINWGPLDTGLLDNQDLLKGKLDSMGFRLTLQSQIREILSALILANWTQSVPVILNGEAFSKRIHQTPMPCLLKWFQHVPPEPVQTNISESDASLDKALEIRFMQPPFCLQAYEGFVQVLVTRILSVATAHVNRKVSLFEVGLDSVTGMMMVSLIERATSFKLSAVNVISGELTVASVAQVLEDCASKAVQ